MRPFDAHAQKKVFPRHAFAVRALALVLAVAVVGGWLLFLPAGYSPEAAHAEARTHIAPNAPDESAPALTSTPTPICNPSWSAVTSPNPSSTTNHLFGVTTLAPNEAWAVGSYRLSGGYATLTMHWDGSQWAHIPSPNRE